MVYGFRMVPALGLAVYCVGRLQRRHTHACSPRDRQFAPG